MKFNLNTPLRILITIVVVSLVVAGVCYYALGGFVASLAGAPSWLPGSIRVSGSLAGFLIVFFAMLHAYERLYSGTKLLRVSLHKSPPLRRFPAPKIVKYSVRKRTTGDLLVHETKIFWEAGGPSIELRDVDHDDLVMIHVTTADDKTFETAYFSPMNPIIPINELSE